MSDFLSFLFPHTQLTTISGKPTNTLLQVLKQQLYNNASSIPSRRGDGAHGHLGVVLDPVKNIPWTNPVHPGDIPTHAQGLTSVLCKLINRQYGSDLAVCELYNRIS
jgi:hypothetical protein